ncbi:MAG: ParA family protein [Ruminococcaceae bacterium]|nr:ParA family protein [Oscillospiraceae bacterium]
MGKIIAIANQKGGVGKTTTSVNLTAALGEHKKKCLIIDLDPQANSTSGFGLERPDMAHSSYELIMGEGDVLSLVQPTQCPNVSMIPACMELAGADIELVSVENREMKLKNRIAVLRERYDYIIIDSQPSLGLLPINALCAADTVLIPIQCEFYALEGLSQLTSTIAKIKRLYNPMLEIEGVLMTMYDSRLNLTQEVAAQVKKYFPRQVFKTTIPRTVRLSEASSYGQPMAIFDKRNKGAVAYDSLAKELIKRNR